MIAAASELFSDLGFNGTSIDDLLIATGLKRGSLYKAFGSKRNLFELCLRSAMETGLDVSPQAQDLLIVALKELASKDAVIALICKTKLAQHGEANLAKLLGMRLLNPIKES